MKFFSDKPILLVFLVSQPISLMTWFLYETSHLSLTKCAVHYAMHSMSCFIVLLFIVLQVDGWKINSSIKRKIAELEAEGKHDEAYQLLEDTMPG